MGICIMTLLVACYTRTSEHLTQKTATKHFVIDFPTLERSQIIISSDDKEHFFSRINDLDMSIQMQNNPDVATTKNYLEVYKKFLQAEVLSPSKSDIDKVKNSFDTIAAYLDKLEIKLDIDSIHIIKITGAAYGAEAFYTRENCILIPAAQFSMSDEGFRNVMLHELFHIISRYDEKVKTESYALIGFQKIKTFQIQDKNLKERVLLNPDGLSNDYAISLSDPTGKTMEAVPIIYSKQNRYQQFVPDFFNYIQFDLFGLEKNDIGVPYVKGQSEDIEPIDQPYYSDFFTQISDNTQYIIHPDEIMADNFMIMINTHISDNFEGFSADGKAILDKLHKIFTSNNQ